jgi:two-component system NtrC family response regulator
MNADPDSPLVPRRTILLVDDDDSLRRVVDYMLNEDGFIVVPASSGEEALQAIDGRSIDLVLSDVRMPGMDGVQLLERVKGLKPELPVVLLTAHGTIAAAVEAMRIGAFDYLTKPLDRDRLKATVRKAIEMAALARENQQLRQVVAERFSFPSMIAGSRAMRAVTDTASRLAQTDTTVLLEGESGTGKELLAKAIHFHSSRTRGPFVTINCGAIPEQLLESELFGHRRGSFTGAIGDKRGKFEAADRGTIFLDEIGELPLPLQVKLLRVLQEREIDKIGDTRPTRIDVRVIAATNRDLDKMVADGTFRDDLYFRLAVVPLRLPALRERTDDVPALVEHFIEKHRARLKKSRPDVDAATYEALNRYAWPGNIRELENVVERALVLDLDNRIGVDDLPPRLKIAQDRVGTVRMELPDDGVSLEEVERDLLVAALDKHDWNQTRAAAYLKITRSTLIYRIQKFGLERGGVGGAESTSESDKRRSS